MANYDFKDLRVLLCDDSLQIRALVRNCLMAFGINDIVEASDAKTGFQEMMDSDPDLVITDWNMPMGDGIDLVHLIRHSPDSPNTYVPIIMLTG